MFKNITFQNGKVNNANGGAIHGKGLSDLKILNCNFVNCYSSSLGGAVSLESCNNTNISYCYFESCRSNDCGGAIRIAKSLNSFVENTIFIGSSSTHGGAIVIGGSSDTYSKNTFIKNCNFINNTASETGGSIAHREGNNLSIIDSYFEGNTATKEGGALHFSGSGNNITNCHFKGNSATDYGGAIYVSSNLNMENSTFLNNHANSHGGDLFFIGYNLKVLYCNFTGSYSKYGGSIHLGPTGLGQKVNNVFINFCNFADIYSTNNGGCIDVYSTDDINILNSNFSNCNCTKFYGGAISTNNANNLNISYCIFDSCKSKDNGGAIRLASSKNINIFNSIFSDCGVEGNGGGLYVGKNDDGSTCSNVLIKQCDFINNSANNGGAVNFVSSANIMECNFINNSASYGGAVNVAFDSVSFEGCVFANCSSGNDGAAIYWNNGKNLEIDYCSFERCGSENGSMSISFNSGTSVYTVSNCIFDIVPEGIEYYYDSYLDVNDLSVVQGDDIILSVRLYSVLGPLNGRKITFIINGEEYNKTTFSDGSVEFNIKNYLHNLGEYNITVNWGGIDAFKPVSNISHVRINSYVGVLSVNQTGKYYEDTWLNFKLINSKTGQPIQYAPIKTVFSNGKTASLTTDENGLCGYNIPFAPGSYNVTSYVDRENVDVNSVKLTDIVIEKITGEIEVAQLGVSRALNVMLFNPDNGDVYRNVKVSLEFSPNSAYVDMVTNDNGIATYQMPFDIGTYSVVAKVTGDYKEFANGELKNITITNDSGSSDENPSVINFGSKTITVEYLKSASTTFAIVGGTISSENIVVVNHPEITPKLSGNRITVSGLEVGTYTVRVITTPNEGYYSVVGTFNITVKKVSAVIKASLWSDYPKSKKVWKIKLINSNTKKPLAKMQIVLKVYNGGKLEKTLKRTTNSKGEVSLKPSSWKVGKHTVKISLSKTGFSCKTISKTVKVLKPTKLTFTIKSKAKKDGTAVSIWVKAGKKPIKKGVKIYIYVPNRKQPITLVTGTYKNNKGFIGYGTNILAGGKYKITVKPVDLKYTGSKTVKITIKKGTIQKNRSYHYQRQKTYNFLGIIIIPFFLFFLMKVFHFTKTIFKTHIYSLIIKIILCLNNFIIWGFYLL